MNTLTELNFELYAAKFYDNPNCLDVEEFNDDLNRISYIKRLFKRYRNTGEIKERLVLNHLTVLYNVFYHEACTRMLVLRLNEYVDILKPFLMYLNYWPEKIIGIEDQILSSDVVLDIGIIAKLRKY
jgi:hypothetical protein